MHKISLPDLIRALNTRYLNQFKTRLVGGFAEPFYQAARGEKWAQIQFREDFYRSALHELAHWCVAGKKRRLCDDYGYWYAEDGRNQRQQDEFFKVEIKPQAIEWAFATTCAVEFAVSVDNLHTDVSGVETFKQNVAKQLREYQQHGFPKRCQAILALLHHLRQS